MRTGLCSAAEGTEIKLIVPASWKLFYICDPGDDCGLEHLVFDQCGSDAARRDG